MNRDASSKIYFFANHQFQNSTCASQIEHERFGIERTEIHSEHGARARSARQ